MDGFAFFRLNCFDYSDLQLFALFIFDVDFSKTYLKTSAENSVSEPPNLKIFSPRPLYKVRAFGTRDNALPLQNTYNRRQNELRHVAQNWAFYVFLTSKGGNIAFLPHPLRAMLCPCSSYL